MDRGPQMGVISEFGRAFEDWINARHKTGTRSFHITLVRAVIAMTGIERAKEMPVSANFNELLPRVWPSSDSSIRQRLTAIARPC